MYDTFRMMAHYNRWANRRLYHCAGKLTPDEFAADRGVFFRSMSGTLNHLLATDRIWMRRMTGTGDAPDRLDAVLFPEFAPLVEARAAEDERIVAFVDSLDETALQTPFTYRPVTNPRDITQPLMPVLSHLFNHQTHHRGQAHAILTGMKREAPSLDLILFQRESGMGF
ncbi:DinB family protein [Aureimonas psammosilenae]|uniref:DinB family protein n=1 Tax=Aureimonas psammosilenae TaxID=2495496 RepID=UPI001260AA6B|nr:DinB family protein [Aureimonas psammosilenae]